MLLLSLFIMCLLPAAGCYSYQTEPLFLTFSELAALEAESRRGAGHARPATGEARARALEVRCHEDSVEVVLRAPRFDPGLPLEPWRLRLGIVPAPPCTARLSGPGEVNIRAPLQECGGSVVLTQAALLYSNLLLYVPPASARGRFQMWSAAIPLQCQYGRRFVLSSRGWSQSGLPSSPVERHFRLTDAPRVLEVSAARGRRAVKDHRNVPFSGLNVLVKILKTGSL